jgi:hypothetical protein
MTYHRQRNISISINVAAVGNFRQGSLEDVSHDGYVCPKLIKNFRAFAMIVAFETPALPNLKALPHWKVPQVRHSQLSEADRSLIHQPASAPNRTKSQKWHWHLRPKDPMAPNLWHIRTRFLG